jgi:putative DNA methylase
MDSSRRFIEESFPVKEVSVESAREKNIRHGHISTLHIWWARRPLASSRATNYAALIPAIDPNINPDEWNNKRNFIIDLSKWGNSLNQTMIQKAREDILKANGGKPPRVLDPFAGGGAIPLEALRLGCEVYASDYNPVATLILKCTLEYPQKYGKLKKVKANDWTGAEETVNPLLEDVKRWGDWVLNEAKKEIGRFYPPEADGSVSVGYIWARTIPCQKPNCGAEIPLMRQFWLARKDKRKVSLFPYVVGKEVKFKIVGTGYEPMPDNFNPEDGTVSRAIATCPVCGYRVDDKTTRQLFQNRKSGQRMVAVVTSRAGTNGKKYRISTAKDVQSFQKAEEYLKEKRDKLIAEWGMDPVPDEEMPRTMPGGIHTPTYGMTTWGSIFNNRQKLALVIFAEKTKAACRHMLEEGYEGDYARAVGSYLAIAVDKIAIYQTSLGYWHNTRELVNPGMGRQALQMAWDYAESNIFAGNADWESAASWLLKVIEHCSSIYVGNNYENKVNQQSATFLQYPDDFFDAVFTDPPYYYNVTYADLSDFFYVWLKRVIGEYHAELFSTPLTPKSAEIIEGAFWDSIRYCEKDHQWFEQMLTQSFREIQRVLKPNGVATVVYAHTSTAGWETLINSLLDSSLVVTGAWPIHTEMKERLMAKESAALASSIYIVARKMARQPTGFYNNVQEELKQHLNRKLERLWQEGVSGADFFIAAIGSAIEVFGKYEKVMDYEGNIVRADRLLQDVRKIATDYAVHQILHNGFSGEISDLTRFYVLYRWNYGEARVEFDEARKLAQSCSIDLTKEWNHGGFVRKDKEFIKVIGPQERHFEDLGNSAELIDVLHGTLLLWEKGRRNEMVKLLHKSGYGTGDAFYRVAQAVSETLPIESKEKKLLDGFLAGRERLIEEVRKEATQGRFF